MMIRAYPEAYPEAKIFLDRGLIFLYNPEFDTCESKKRLQTQ